MWVVPDSAKALAIGQPTWLVSTIGGQLSRQRHHASLQFIKWGHAEFGAFVIADALIDGWLHDVTLMFEHDGAVQLRAPGVQSDLVARFGMDQPGTFNTGLVGFK